MNDKGDEIHEIHMPAMHRFGVGREWENGHADVVLRIRGVRRGPHPVRPGLPRHRPGRSPRRVPMRDPGHRPDPARAGRPGRRAGAGRRHPSGGLPVADRHGGAAVTSVTCPFGHRISTDAPPGSEVRCGACRTETGDTVTVIVPGGPPEPDAPAPPPRHTGGWGGPCRRCRCWSRRPAGAKLPPGWLMLTIGTDPATDPAGRASKTAGPYCGLACATVALRGEPRGRGRDHLRTLMTEPPSGRDR